VEKKGLEADHNSPVTIELMDAAAIADAIRDASRHFAHLEKKQRLYVIGLATRGVPLAVRLTEELKKAGIDAVAGSLFTAMITTQEEILKCRVVNSNSCTMWKGQGCCSSMMYSIRGEAFALH